MHALNAGARALAIAAVSLLGIVKAAEAAPLSSSARVPVAAGAGQNLLVNVADYYTYRERRVVIREYDDDDDYYADYGYYDRPSGYVYSGYRYYDDYYDPDVGYRGGIHVRAPFVDIYIP